MTNKIKEVLNSEKGMAVINLLFLLSVLIRNCGIIYIAYMMWIVYLVYSIKRSSSKTVKIIYGIFIAFAVSIIVGNLYFMLKYAG